MDTGEALIAYEAHGVSRVAFSPDERRLFSGHGDSSILAWDVATLMHARNGDIDNHL
jgi:WD40 repeat protein